MIEILGVNYLNVKEATEKLSVCRKTLRNWETQGRIRCRFLGVRKLYKESELIKLIKD